MPGFFLSLAAIFGCNPPSLDRAGPATTGQPLVPHANAPTPPQRPRRADGAASVATSPPLLLTLRGGRGCPDATARLDNGSSPTNPLSSDLDRWAPCGQVGQAWPVKIQPPQPLGPAQFYPRHSGPIQRGAMRGGVGRGRHDSLWLPNLSWHAPLPILSRPHWQQVHRIFSATVVVCFQLQLKTA